MKLNIAYNKQTQQLIGYSTPKKGEAIVVTAYAVDDLERKFKKVIADRIAALKEKKASIENYHKVIEYLAGQDKREVELMIESAKGLIT